MTNDFARFRESSWAIAGASDDRGRYGYKIFRVLADAGFRVTPLHPRLTEIDGVKVYPSIADAPGEHDVLVFVVNPRIGETLLEPAKAAGIKTAWFQPGARSAELREKAVEMGFDVVDDCVLVRIADLAPDA